MNGLRNNVAARRFEMDEAGHAVFADDRLGEKRLIIDHVEAPAPLRATGAAGRFMTRLAAFARSNGPMIVPRRGYAARWSNTSARDRDVIADPLLPRGP